MFEYMPYTGGGKKSNAPSLIDIILVRHWPIVIIIDFIISISSGPLFAAAFAANDSFIPAGCSVFGRRRRRRVISGGYIISWKIYFEGKLNEQINTTIE